MDDPEAARAACWSRIDDDFDEYDDDAAAGRCRPEAMGRGRNVPTTQRPVGQQPGVRPAAADPAAALEAQVTS